MSIPIINNEEKDFLESLKQIVRSAHGIVYASINYAQVQANWLLGQRIVKQMQKSEGSRIWCIYCKIGIKDFDQRVWKMIF